MITADVFGVSKDGKEIKKFTLVNQHRVTVEIISLGGAIIAIRVPDRKGVFQDVVTGFDNLQDYEGQHPYFGVLVGRFANRIDKGKFELDGESYQLAVNNGPNHLHGGPTGFSRRVWESSVEGDTLKLTFDSQDGEESYPGHVTVTVTYQLTEDNQLVMDYTATSSRPTPINLTNHSYFNLAGHASGNVYNHLLSVNADRFTPKNENNIPTGEVAPVAGTVFDLRAPVLLGQRIAEVIHGDVVGFDHNFCLNGDGRRLAARLEDTESGRALEVHTTQPGIQVYTANYFPADGIAGKAGATYRQHAACALETQNFPDAINKKEFPNCVLRPGETYHHTTWLMFSVVPQQ